MKKSILSIMVVLLIGLAPAAALAGEFLAGTVSNENWHAYYGRSENRQAAIDQAVRNCGGTQFCRDEIEVVESGECIALVDSKEAVTIAWGTSPKKASADALRRCNERGRTGCWFMSMECAR